MPRPCPLLCPRPRPRLLLPALVAAALAWGPAARALERVEFLAPQADRATLQALKSASALWSAGPLGKRTAQDLFAEARAEYGRLIEALYALGYYAPVVHVWVNGREAADISALDAPRAITALRIEVDPGPRFRFATLRIAPLAKGSVLAPGFAPGAPALSGQIQAAVTAAIEGWRAKGHALAGVAAQTLLADHDRATLSADIALAPGPVLRFGTLRIVGAERLRAERIRAIAGLTPGLRYAPAALERAAERLRATGVFASVRLQQAPGPRDGDLLDITAELVEAKRRRYAFGAELGSRDGAELTGQWLHRNLWGGAERLTIWGEVANLAAQASGVDYRLGLSLERPATPGPDTTAGVFLELGHQDEADYRAQSLDIGLSFGRWFDRRLTGQAGLSLALSRGRDAAGDFSFRALEAPLGLTWDNRDSDSDARRGAFAEAALKPFLGLGGTDDGARLTLDLRGYRSLGAGRATTLALRLQAGAVLGADPLQTPRDDLFYAGGGGTVRGLPYQSLGARIEAEGETLAIGGNRFLGASLEARQRLGDGWGLVAFADAGMIGLEAPGAAAGDWQAGAGLGLRYETGFGPIRLDLALPVRGGTPGDVQVYLGLGQAF